MPTKKRSLRDLYGPMANEPQLRAMNEEMGDIETSMEIAAQMGPVGRHWIDPGQLNTIGEPSQRVSAAGLYSRPTNRKAYLFKEAYGGEGVGVSPDNIYTLGADNANPLVQSHEYRHRWDEQEGMGMGEENNLLWDAFRAKNASQWMDTVKSYTAWLRKNKKEEGMGNISIIEVEEMLKDRLNKSAAFLANQEAEALRERGYNGDPSQQLKQFYSRRNW